MKDNEWERLNPEQVLSLGIGVIRWEAPPPVRITGVPRQRLPYRRPVRRPWALIAAQLKAKPGVYGLIDDDGTGSSAYKIKRGGSWWYPPGAFHAVTRLICGRVHVWACFRPGNGQGAGV